MAITVRDLLKLPYFEPVTVVAGRSGLDRPVIAAGILDYEYAEGYTMKEQVFLRDSLVVSSLLFAKDSSDDLLVNTLRELIHLGIAGIAYKSILIENLPEAVLRMANEHNFPILKFGTELYMEEFIFQIIDNIQLERQIKEKEAILDTLISGHMPKEELHQAAKYLAPYWEQNLCCVYVAQKKRLEFPEFERFYRGPTGVERIDSGITVCRYKNGFFLLFWGGYDEKKRYIARFQDVMAYLPLNTGGYWIGCGAVARCPVELDSGLQQAYFASICAQAKHRQVQDYEDMGVYQILIPHMNSAHLLRYMEQFLNPLLEESGDGSKELLNTAIAYILEDGDIGKAAEYLYCHKNTVRYRLNKLHERLSPNSSDSVFFERLSIAIKIYLLLHPEES